ncbi:MAG TPA: glycosyltransferase family 4 protein [Ktedonobacteraceae bacterium]|jgi:glycosyltransferase involved in cell wall biosynthesis|nr:glycosyltransferase family 4 protein [Ktedonobacteraceae bacterium]
MFHSSSVHDHTRVCVLSFKFHPFIGGAEVQAEKHARHIQKLGHEALVLTLRHNKQWEGKEDYKGLPIIRVGSICRHKGWMRLGKFGHPFFMLGVFLALWRLRQQYDVIHVMQMSSLAAIAVFIGNLLQKPTIISIQSAGPDERQVARIRRDGAMLMADTLEGVLDSSFFRINIKNWIPGALECLQQTSFAGGFTLRYLKRSNAFYQVLSTRSYQYLVRNGIRPEQIISLPNGVDTAVFQPAAQVDRTRTERDIVCVARLEYPKGVDVLLHAWGRMMHEPAEWRSHLKPRLRLVGGGLFRPQFERFVAELGIQDSVEFLGQRRDVPDLLQHAWGFVLPSRWEGMPNALIEAMSCGLPCVATRVSGSEDVISEGSNGLLVEPENPEAMARALRRILEDGAFAQQLGQEARQTVLRKYHITALAEQCLQFYHQLQAAHNERSANP